MTNRGKEFKGCRGLWLTLGTEVNCRFRASMRRDLQKELHVRFFHVPTAFLSDAVACWLAFNRRIQCLGTDACR